MSLDNFELELPEPVAIKSKLVWACKKPIIFLAARKGNEVKLIKPLYKAKAIYIILGSQKKGDFVFYGELPNEIVGHNINFYSMNRSMGETESILQTITDLETNKEYSGEVTFLNPK